MPISGSAPSKVFSRQINAFTGSDAWTQLENSGRKILSADQDTEANDIASALNSMLMKDGGNFASDVDVNGNKFTNVENASARTHFAAAGQVADSSLIYAGTSAGTDTVTASVTPAITAYAAGQRFHFKAGGTNTGAATININSVGAKDLKKGPDGATALAAGDITAGGMYTVEYDGTNMQLLNPKFPVGFATTDSPTFANPQVTTIELGHASDTTLARGSAGVVTVEGTALLRASQNLGDVASAATAFGNIKQAASDTATGVLEIAVQSEMETGTSTTLAVTPGRQHFHPGHPKAGGNLDGTGTPAFAAGDYGMGAVTDNGTGNYTLALDTAFANTNYWWTASARAGTTSSSSRLVVSPFSDGSKTTSALQIGTGNVNDGAATDSTETGISFWGDYA
jgi:hypothetical protein